MPEWTDRSSIALSEQQEIAALQQTNELLQENLAQMERMFREDSGWRLLGQQDDALSDRGRKGIARHARFMAMMDPMIKRALALRVGYVWGQGVNVSIDAQGDEGQDVNGVIEQFWDDKSNKRTFTDTQAQEDNERQLGTDGEVFAALPTNPTTGRVQVRLLPPEEIDRIIHDPEDKDTHWYYLRNYSQTDPFTGKVTQSHDAYPSLGYYPAVRPPRVKVGDTDFRVRWDAPVRLVQVNRHRGRGVGDAVPALPWAKLHKEFLEDWAQLAKALSRIAWKVTTRGDRAQKAARAIAQPANSLQNDLANNPRGAGATIGLDPNSTLEAVPKTGAQIDANSSQPLQVMIAATLDVPITMLTGDPGTTGARAVAQTLDQPTEHAMGLRRRVWTAAIIDICDYVIDQAVIAPAGPLKGSVKRDGDRMIVTLPETDSRDVRVDWPEWDSLPVNVLMDAITKADSTDKVPPLLVFKMIAAAFNIEDVDEWIDKQTDDQGNWIPLDVADEQARGRQADQGGTNPFGGPPEPADQPAADQPTPEPTNAP